MKIHEFQTHIQDRGERVHQVEAQLESERIQNNQKIIIHEAQTQEIQNKLQKIIERKAQIEVQSELQQIQSKQREIIEKRKHNSRNDNTIKKQKVIMKRLKITMKRLQKQVISIYMKFQILMMKLLKQKS